jgi:hypothetical protein
MMVAQTGWRTLAEPTYGVEAVPDGTAGKLKAGVRIQPALVATNVLGAKLALVSPTGSYDDAGLWYVAPTALRFEGEG